METRWIDIPLADNLSFSGYLALPPTGTGPGVVLIQELWGVNEHIRTLAQQYALDGYVVLAPDLYWRQEPRVDLLYDEAGTERAREYKQQLDIEQSTLDIVAAVSLLKSLPEVHGGVGLVGYCMGGLLAYRAAASGAGDAVVAYYGGGIQNNLHLAQRIDQPILFHFAGQDRVIPQDAALAIRDAFEDHVNAYFFDYPNSHHGFNCWQRPAYDQKAAARAHGRTLSFLASRL